MADTDTQLGQQRWLPLEANPDVWNKYVQKMGVPDTWTFTDIYGLDPELLQFVPQPVLSVLLLYPITEKSETEMIGEQRETHPCYYIKQTIGNACGTIGLIHALANNQDSISFPPASDLGKFLARTKDMTPAQRADDLGGDRTFGEAHEEAGTEGQTEAPPVDTKTNLHFVSFVCRDGGLYEMDGRKKGPVFHSSTCKDTFLTDTVAVVKKFMARDPDELNFTLVALTPA